MKKLFVLCSILFLLCSAGLGGLYYSLPDHLTESPNSSQAIVLLDRNDQVIRSYNPNEAYDWLVIDQMPKELMELVILAEDQNFLEHEGIDFLGTLRSAWLNLKAQRVVSGASTITQQSYRLSHSLPRNFLGKLESMLGALKVEKKYKKKQILEHYLNTVPLGKRVLGMKRAAEVFFQKDIELLSLSEMATLAVLPRSPSNLQSKKDQSRLLNLRNKLLDRYQSKYQKDQELIAFEKKVPLQMNADYSGWDNYHFGVKVMAEKNFPRFVGKDGRVKTTLDIYLQKEASSILKAQIKHLEQYQVSNGAVLVLDTQTGDVLAYVGNADPTNFRGGQYDALTIPRQVGSTLKPFTYALALMDGASLNQTLPDIPSYYKTGLGQFLPRNYDQEFSGPRLMREALANSLNLPAVALADQLGVLKLHTFLKNLGLPLDRPADHYGVGLTLGNAEIPPLNLASTYTALARKGTRIKTRFFLEEEVESIPTPLGSKEASLISHVLDDRVARREAFGERNVFDLPFSLSVKTGTSTDFRDNWSVGFNDKFTILVWVGNMDQKPMKKVSGITGAGPVLSEVARYLAKRISVPRLELAQGLEARTICALSGKAPGKACRHKKVEYFKNSDPALSSCDYHQEYIVRDCSEPGDEKKLSFVTLPDIYHSYVFDHPEWSLEGQIANYCSTGIATVIKTKVNSENPSLAIVRPLPDSIYAVDPNIPKQFQKLKLEINRYGQIKKVIWTVDDKEKFEDDSNLDWPMTKGKHRFKAEVIFEDGHKESSEDLAVTVL